MKLRVNLLCILGGPLGVVSLFMIWAVRHTLDLWALVGSTSYSGFDFLAGHAPYEPQFWTDTYMLSPILFAVGSTVAFVTPLGGGLQVAGALYFLSWAPLYNPRAAFSGEYYVLGVGWYIGLVAGALTLLSLVHPIGLNCRERPRSALSRMVSISRIG